MKEELTSQPSYGELFDNKEFFIRILKNSRPCVANISPSDRRFNYFKDVGIISTDKAINSPKH